MTYHEDPNINRRSSHPMTEDRSYTGWIVGGIVAVAVVLGIFAMTSGTDNTNTASNTNRPAATTPATTPATSPATTGSGSALPNNPNGTTPQRDMNKPAPAPAR